MKAVQYVEEVEGRASTLKFGGPRAAKFAEVLPSEYLNLVFRAYNRVAVRRHAPAGGSRGPEYLPPAALTDNLKTTGESYMTTHSPDLKSSPDAQGANDGNAMQNAERAAAQAKDAANTGIESGRQAYDEAKEYVGAGAHAAKEKMNSAYDAAKDKASNIADSVSGAASYAGQKAEEATSSVGEALESTGQYLKEDGLHHIASDLTELIRRNPVPAMLIGIGLGFLFAQASSRRNS